MDILDRANKLLKLSEVTEYLKEKYATIPTDYASEYPDLIHKEGNRYFKGCYND